MKIEKIELYISLCIVSVIITLVFGLDYLYKTLGINITWAFPMLLMLLGLFSFDVAENRASRKNLWAIVSHSMMDQVVFLFFLVVEAFAAGFISLINLDSMHKMFLVIFFFLGAPYLLSNLFSLRVREEIKQKFLSNRKRKDKID